VVFAKPAADGPAAWVVFDDIVGDGEHELVSRYRFVPGVVEVDADTRTVVSADDDGNLLIRTLEEGVATDVVDRIAVHPDGEFGEAPAAEFALTTDLPAAFTTILLPFDDAVPPEALSQLLQPTSGTGRAAWIEMGDQAILVGIGEGECTWDVPGAAELATGAPGFAARYDRDGDGWALASVAEARD
jgi:hypothetical protein